MFEPAGAEPGPEVAHAGVVGEPGDFGEAVRASAFDFGHFEAAADGAGDDAEAEVAGVEPFVEAGVGGAEGLVFLPVAGGAFGAVGHDGDDGEAGGCEFLGGVEGAQLAVLLLGIGRCFLVGALASADAWARVGVFDGPAERPFVVWFAVVVAALVAVEPRHRGLLGVVRFG